MKKLINIYTIAFICILNIQGQNVTTPQIIPASPDAAGIGKYGAYPVSHYTGVPVISIPLYELNAGEITLPISLSYHASGIRVDDIASSVGLGWSLNAGGCISVDVKGKPDIIPAEYYAGNLTNRPYTRYNAISFEQYLDRSQDINLRLPRSVLIEIASGSTNFDMEPDIYNFNIGDISGQFIIDDNNNIRFFKNSAGLKAMYDKASFSFIVIDNKGKKYIFKDKELTTTIGWKWGMNTNYTFQSAGLLPGNSGYSAWYISQIIGENGIDTVDFEYETAVEKYTTRKMGHLSSQSINYSGDAANCSKSIVNQGSWILPPNISADFNSSIIYHHKQQLSEIRYKQAPTIIKFDKSNRLDINGGNKIDKISVLYDNNNILSWNFSYDYFNTVWESNETDPQFPTTSIALLNKRLKLNSIQETGKNALSIKKPYVFNYYDEYLNLPYRNCTNGFDHWGYFNSELFADEDVNNGLKSFPEKTSSYSFPILPQEGIFLPYSGTSSDEPPAHFTIFGNSLNTNSYLVPNFSFGGNREPSEYYAKALSLKSICYPTGGISEFEYECNSYTSVWNSTQTGKTGGIRIKKIVDKTDNDSIVKQYEYAGGIVYSLPNYLNIDYHIKKRYSEFRRFNNFSDISPYSYGEKIGYSQVVEKLIDSKTNASSKIIYNFYSPVDYALGCYEKIGLIMSISNTRINQSDNLYSNPNIGRNIIRPFDISILGKSYKYGLIKSIQQYKNNTLINEEFREYDNITGDLIFGNRFTTHEGWLFDANCTYYNELGSLFSYYFINIYFHETGKNFLKRKTEKVYDISGANPVIKSTIYEYDTNTELLKSSTDSIGNKMIRSEIKYPTNYTNFPYYQGNPHPLQQMQMRNMINYPIEQKTFVNSKLTNAIITTYLSDNPSSSTGKIFPNAIYGLNTNVPMTDFAALTAGDGNTAYNFNSNISQEMTYTYYPDGNTKEVKSNKTGVTTTYLWSYKGQYPVAEIINGTYSTVVYALNGYSPVTLINSLTPDMTKVNLLRTSIYLGSAQVNTFTYSPLVGILTKTDSRGIITYYEYDNMNRLKETYIIENGVKKVLQKYDYHYQNQ